MGTRPEQARRRLKTATVVWAVLILLAPAVAGCAVLRAPLAKPVDLGPYINAVVADVQNERWESAAANLEHVRQGWARSKNVIWAQSEIMLISDFEASLTRVAARIARRARGEAMEELAVLTGLWHNVASTLR